MTTIGEISGIVDNLEVTLDPGMHVTFQVGEDDEKISIQIREGKLHVHSHAWGKNLAVIGEAANVVRLAVVDR